MMSNLREAYLKHICIFAQSKDPNAHLLRTLICNWFAYSVGGPWLNSNGRPRWLNTPHPMLDQELLKSCHAHSKTAKRLIGAGGEKGDLKLEHSIPISVLGQHLHRLENESIENFLREYYAVAVITADEDKLLNEHGFRRRMPNGEFSAMARYDAGGIEMVQNTVSPQR